ncbi:partial protein O-GlcNAc transferase, partial [Methylacidimicrobium cyclopophantes]
GGRLAPPALTNAERVAALLLEAKRFENEGDRKLARAALSEAEELDPQNPTVLEEEGELAAQQNNISLATEYWSRIVSLGPSAGAFYQRARNHLEEAARSEGTDSSETAFRHRAKTPLQLVGTERTSGNGGSPFGQELIFRFRIAADPRTKISLGQISYQFYAYDQIDAGIIVPTNARMTVGFESAFPRWGANHVEVLRVTYRLDHPVPHQRFYGYVFRLFYSGLLQDQRADPPELLLRLPSSKGK